MSRSRQLDNRRLKSELRIACATRPSAIILAARHIHPTLPCHDLSLRQDTPSLQRHPGLDGRADLSPPACWRGRRGRPIRGRAAARDQARRRTVPLHPHRRCTGDADRCVVMVRLRTQGSWLHYKATLAFGLLAYTLHCRRILFDIKSGRNERNTTWLKIFACGQLLVLVAMVVLAVPTNLSGSHRGTLFRHLSART